MPTPTYDLIASSVLSSSASSVTFSSIPATYRDLVLVASAKAVEGDGVITMNLNSDSGANYNYVEMAGNGSLTDSEANSGLGTLRLGNNFNVITTSNFNLAKLEFLDYSATNKHKTILMRTNEASLVTYAVAARYASTSAITTILLAPLGFTNFASGSSFHLYGIAS